VLSSMKNSKWQHICESVILWVNVAY
jgi:hypothetical protein